MSPRFASLHRWIRAGFAVWAVVSTLWLVGTFRTRGVPPALLASDGRVRVESSRETLAFLPTAAAADRGLVFIAGGGVAAEAYAPLLRPLAEAGHPVFVVRLPLRIAPLERHKAEVVRRARALLGELPGVESWVVAGHSLGGALACRVAARPGERLGGLVLIGTSHPKQLDLSGATIPIVKVSASNDGIATAERIAANRGLLPAGTRWIEIQGGNHSQFGHYGRQLFDGRATISREEQQAATRRALAEALGG